MLIICSSSLCKKRYIHSKPKILVKIHNFWTFSAKNAWKENKCEIYFLSNKNIISFLIFWQRYFLKIFVHHGENRDQSWTRNTNWECVVETDQETHIQLHFTFTQLRTSLQDQKRNSSPGTLKLYFWMVYIFLSIQTSKETITLNCSCWFQNKISK